jgi:hypothetical protein
MQKSIIVASRGAMLFLILLSHGAPVRADGMSDVLAAFQQYVARSDKFDPSVADLYADNATITSKRIMPDGTTQTLSLSGSQWKALIEKAMPIAKHRGDRNTFRNVSATSQSNAVIVTADRYSHLKAYTSPFFQHWTRKRNGAWKISTEITETRP